MVVALALVLLLVAMVARWVAVTEAPDRFQYAKYVFMVNVHTDIDGAWSDTNREAVDAREKLSNI